MDPRLEAWIREHYGPHSYGEQDANGVDLSLIRANFRMACWSRNSATSPTADRDAAQAAAVAGGDCGLAPPPKPLWHRFRPTA